MTFGLLVIYSFYDERLVTNCTYENPKDFFFLLWMFCFDETVPIFVAQKSRAGLQLAYPDMEINAEIHNS